MWRKLLSKIFNNEDNITEEIIKETEETSLQEETKEEIPKDLFLPENSEKLIEYLKDKKLNTLNCKYSNRWLNCPYSANPDNYIMTDRDQLKLSDRLHYHYYVNNKLFAQYIDKDHTFLDLLYKNKDEINQTFDFINKRIVKFENNYGKDYKIQIDLFDNQYERINKYSIKDLPIYFHNSADVIIYNDNHCEFIKYTLSTFDLSLNILEFYFYAICFFSHFEHINKDYTCNFLLYKPTIESKYYKKTYVSESSGRSITKDYETIKNWYEQNKYNIIKSALGIDEKNPGNWCKYCKHNCYLKGKK